MQTIFKPLLTWLNERADLVDEPSEAVTYLGYYQPQTGDGALTTAQTQALARWTIARITVTGAITLTEYAGGSMAYNQIWDDRAALSYKLKNWQ